MKKQRVDTVIVNAAQLLTLRGKKEGPRSGAAMNDLGIIEDGALAIRAGQIVAVGTTARVKAKAGVSPGTREIDASGKVVMPGFVDAHTHVVFGGSREVEFEMRLQGKSYLEIQKAGGGIRSTVDATRKTRKDDLTDEAHRRLERMFSWGTTTAEAKSGYGLSPQSELKILEVIRRLNARGLVELVPTFLGAHDFPEEFRKNHRGYVRRVIEEMIPEVVRRGLAEFCDVFCEKGFFSVSESESILKAAVRLGLKPKLHADELASSGGAELAGKLGAISADHLLWPSRKGLEALRRGGVIAVLLPGSSFMLRSKRHAPARQMIDLGIPVALGSDLNPGTCTIESMPLIMALACFALGMTPAEAITAATVNAAWAVGRGRQVGSLEKGKQADVIVLDIPDYRFLLYQFAINHVERVIKAGQAMKWPSGEPPLRVKRGGKRHWLVASDEAHAQKAM